MSFAHHKLRVFPFLWSQDLYICRYFNRVFTYLICNYVVNAKVISSANICVLENSHKLLFNSSLTIFRLGYHGYASEPPFLQIAKEPLLQN